MRSQGGSREERPPPEPSGAKSGSRRLQHLSQWKPQRVNLKPVNDGRYDMYERCVTYEGAEHQSMNGTVANPN